MFFKLHFSKLFVVQHASRGHSAVINVCRVEKCPNESCVGVTFSSGTMRLAAGSRLRRLLLLAGANPEKGKQAGWLLEIGSGGKQVIHTSETNAAHCLLQLNIHRSLSQGIHTTADSRREPGGGRWRKS